MYVPPLGRWQSRRTLATAPRSAGRLVPVHGGAPWLPRTRRRGREGRQARVAAAPSPGGNLPSVALTAKAMERPESGRRPDCWRRREGPRPPLAPGQVATYVMTCFVFYKLIIYYCILKICACRTCTLLVYY